ncbi:hypothetical protein LCGC14_1979110 [marine sediment metagenome]|uniref:Uncharacterized protein n=1 Tax=marine sediment metagenome TaxID=412755 RepID=A0A0F9F9S9_9ZZZZ
MTGLERNQNAVPWPYAMGPLLRTKLIDQWIANTKDALANQDDLSTHQQSLFKGQLMGLMNAHDILTGQGNICVCCSSSFCVARHETFGCWLHIPPTQKLSEYARKAE